MRKFAVVASVLMIGSWAGLLLARGQFWNPPADGLRGDEPGDAPAVAAIVPARDEAAVIGTTLPTLLGQRYGGALSVTLADDHSSDATGAIARSLGADVIAVGPRPDGWAGKVWAMASAVAAVRERGAAPAYWLFTDADITHPPDLVSRLVATARGERRDLVSLMVQLNVASTWERLLIPAFVFFFAKLYPFAWVADDHRATAAAAGGCVLLSDAMLQRIGGIESIAGALIDDCSLAGNVKRAGGRLSLQLSSTSRSIRPYPHLADIWQMVARSAYTQLRHSPAVLAGTVAGMLFLYLLPPIAAVAGIVRRDRVLAFGGGTAWAMLAGAFVPMLRRYRLSLGYAPLLPLAATLYTAMTVDSAIAHTRGRGGLWKGRITEEKRRG